MNRSCSLATADFTSEFANCRHPTHPFLGSDNNTSCLRQSWLLRGTSRDDFRFAVMGLPLSRSSVLASQQQPFEPARSYRCAAREKVVCSGVGAEMGIATDILNLRSGK